MRRRRRGTQSIEDLSARIEQYAEQILDIAAEERRLLRMLTRLRVARSSLIVALADVAQAVAGSEANLQK